MSQIALLDVAVEFGGTPIFEGASFTVSRGDRWGIVGRNGTGKTTLLNVAAGRLAPTRGAATRASGLRITLLDQHREFGANTSVWKAAAAPFADLRALERSLDDILDDNPVMDWNSLLRQDDDLPEWLTPEERALMEEELQDGLLDIAGIPPLRYFAGDEKRHLKEFIRFCRLGSFEIL